MTTREASMPTLSREITMGDLIKTIVLAIGLVAYFNDGKHDTKDAKDGLAAFKNEISGQLRDLSSKVG
jgi:hypothetical protein